ncbi:MAG: HDOD domain-containing protein [Actinomycetota bacterium]|nr:HDOD domain-containing protein [Actinomycetota bacterium]
MHLRLLEIIDHLPPVGRCVIELLDMAEDQSASAEDTGRVLMADGVLTARVLAEANSVLHMARTPVASAPDAIARLGIPRVATIALATSAMAHFPLGAQPYGLTIEALQDHHRIAASSALALGTSLSHKQRSLLASIAAMHDIGKLLLSVAVLEWSCQPTLISPAGVDIAEFEMEIFDVDHGEVGRAICDHWGIPEVIGIAIQHHHSPRLGGPLAHGALVADIIAHAAPTDDFESLRLVYPQLSPSIAACGLSGESVEKAIRTVQREKAATVGGQDSEIEESAHPESSPT